VGGEDRLELGLQQLCQTKDAPDDAHRRAVELRRLTPPLLITIRLACPSSWGLAPDRERRPGRLAQGVVLLGMAGFAVFAVTEPVRQCSAR
jgi:hypothetical protein